MECSEKECPVVLAVCPGLGCYFPPHKMKPGSEEGKIYDAIILDPQPFPGKVACVVRLLDAYTVQSNAAGILRRIA